MTLLFPSTARSAALAGKYGYDEWLVSRFLQYVPDVEGFLEKMERPPTRYIRVNTLKTTREELASRLAAKGFELGDTAIHDVLAVKKAPLPTGATNEYLLGHYYIQDLSSCVAVEALGAAEGQAVLDMAAAPGGKTTYIAQKMKNTGSIVALELVEKRARSMAFNMERLGVSNTCICKLDGLRAAELGSFDRVLLDAPCSCEGVIAKDPARKTSHLPEDVDYCSSRQEKMLKVAIQVARPGGVIVYSTCSFAPEENEAVIDRAVKEFGVSVEPLAHGSDGMGSFGDANFDSSVRNARRFYPHLHDTTGFFVARLRK
ncbi:MAG: NOL1/NOP2/sun family putative RNA methylase [Nitrososphaera sp.]|uniref:NOL1/NOP2/sun family putative RNA methylase n=1 Tax=Nitrososphaera sp. TaxID=1971748 RepID=UPI003D6FA7E0